MKINLNESIPTVQSRDIAIGEAFLFSDEVYLRVEPHHDSLPVRKNCIYVINLADGEQGSLDELVQVVALTSAVTVKPMVEMPKEKA